MLLSALRFIPAGAAAAAEPATVTVVITGLSLVFGILVLLWLILMVEGKLFESIDRKKKEKAELEEAAKAAPAAPAPAAPAPASAPVVQEGIPPEVVAAIAAAVSQVEGGKYTLRSVTTAQKGHSQWGLAGVISYTEPF